MKRINNEQILQILEHLYGKNEPLTNGDIEIAQAQLESCQKEHEAAIRGKREDIAKVIAGSRCEVCNDCGANISTDNPDGVADQIISLLLKEEECRNG